MGAHKRFKLRILSLLQMVRKSRKSREEWKIYNNVFDEFTKRNIFQLSTQGHFKDLDSPIALGKEANVFYAEKKDGTSVVVKIYRLENCNFNKMYSYISTDPRFVGLENQRRKVIFSWVQREYRNLLIAREKINVPIPLAFKDNILITSFIGNEEPAPQLKDAQPKNPQEFLDKIIRNIKLLCDAGLVHGDLSNFNILNYEEEPIFIDFSQSMPITTQGAREYLERDIKNVLSSFKRILKTNNDAIAQDILAHYDKLMLDKE